MEGNGDINTKGKTISSSKGMPLKTPITFPQTHIAKAFTSTAWYLLPKVTSEQ